MHTSKILIKQCLFVWWPFLQLLAAILNIQGHFYLESETYSAILSIALSPIHSNMTAPCYLKPLAIERLIKKIILVQCLC